MHEENQKAQLEAMATGQMDGSDGVHSSGAKPSDSPYYNRIFWASYKGQSRGVWGGILLGCALGAVGGALLATAIVAMAPAAALGAVMMPMVGIGSMVGMLYGKEVFGLSGAVAGAVSAGMEIAEERRHNEEIVAGKMVAAGQGVTTANMDDHTKVSKMASGELPYEGNESTYLFGQKHHDYGDRPSYFPSVGVAGAAIGALFGAVMVAVGGGLVGGLEHLPIFEHLVSNGGALANAGISAATVTGATVIGGTSLIGATYGINRHYFRQVFATSNSMYDGHLAHLGQEIGTYQGASPQQVMASAAAKGVVAKTGAGGALMGVMMAGHATPSSDVAVTGLSTVADVAVNQAAPAMAHVVSDAAGVLSGGMATSGALANEAEGGVGKAVMEQPKHLVNNVVMAERQQPLHNLGSMLHS